MPEAMLLDLANALAQFERQDPRGEITALEAAEIADIRASYRFRSASDPRVALWESEHSTAWTVIYEQDTWFVSSCLNRLVFVKPLPDDLAEALGPALPWVAAIGIWPVTPENAERAARLQPSRICPLGQDAKSALIVASGRPPNFGSARAMG